MHILFVVLQLLAVNYDNRTTGDAARNSDQFGLLTLCQQSKSESLKSFRRKNTLIQLNKMH